MWPCIVTNFLITKPTRCTNFPNLFWNETLHVSDGSSVHHQELFTVHSAMVYIIQVCRQLSSSSRIRMELQLHPDPAAVYKPSYTIAECTVTNYWWWTEELSETCRLSFSKQIWVISASSWFCYKEICHDARSHECKVSTKCTQILYQICSDTGKNVHRQRAKYVGLLLQSVPTYFAWDTQIQYSHDPRFSLGVTWYNGKSASPSKPWQNQRCVTHKNRFHMGDE
jgi:hypothetical protein